MTNYCKKYNTTQIEHLSVDSVKEAISLTDTLQRFINENDKTPVWDGEILIYNSNDWNKDNIIGRVSVQIKGKLVPTSRLEKDRISFSVGLTELLLYQNDRGTIFFVVLIDKENNANRMVYYETLTPQKIYSYTKVKENQKTCTINLTKLPLDKFDIQSILYNFYHNSRFGNIPPLSLNELSNRKDIIKITANTTVFIPKNTKPSPIDVLLNSKDLAWTAEIEGHPIPIPVDVGLNTILSITSHNTLPIVNVAGNEYLNYVSVTRTIDRTVIKFGDSTSLIIYANQKEAKIIYKSTEYLSKRIKDLAFIIELAENHEINLGDAKIYLGKLISEENFDYIGAIQELESYKAIDRFLKSLHIEDDLNISNINSNSSLEELELIMKVLGGKRSVKIDVDGKYQHYLFTKNLSNLRILFFIEQVNKEKSLYKIYDCFDYHGDVRIVRDGDEQITSIYSALQPDDYCELSNIDFSRMLLSYKELLPTNSEVYNPANYDLLNLLSAYDKNCGRSDILLNTAINIAKWLMNESGDVIPKEIKLINYLQTLKRVRELTEEEKLELCEVSESTTNLMYKIGVNLLLENHDTVRYLYNKLNKSEQVALKSFPIYKFWK